MFETSISPCIQRILLNYESHNSKVGILVDGRCRVYSRLLEYAVFGGLHNEMRTGCV